MAPPATPPPPSVPDTGTQAGAGTPAGTGPTGDPDRQLRDELGYLRRLGRALVGDRADAADLVQATYLRAAPHLAGVTARRAYLRRTMVNLLTDQLRRTAVVREVPTDDVATGRPASGDPYTQVDQRLDLRVALDRLDPTARAIVVLRYLEDLPVAEIAALLGRPAGTVRRISADALRALAPHLTDTTREGRP